MYNFCLTHKYNSELEKINYLNVGMGENKFPDSWIIDSTGDNISKKNNIMTCILFIIGSGKTI